MKLSAKLMLAPAVSGLVMVLTLGTSLGLLAHYRERSEATYGAALDAQVEVAAERARIGALQAGLYRTVAIIGSMNDAAITSYRQNMARTLQDMADRARRITRLDGSVATGDAMPGTDPAGATAGANAASGTPAGTAGSAKPAGAADALPAVVDGALIAEVALRSLKAADTAVDLATVDPNTGVAALQTADLEFERLQKLYTRLFEQNHRAAATQSAELGAQAKLGGLGLVLLGLALVAAASAFAWTLQRKLILQVQQSAEAARRVAAGHLDELPSSDAQDELGELVRALGAMVEQLRETVTSVQQVSETIGVASSEIASGNHDLSSRTEQTASNLQQTASSMEQLTGTVKHSADAASAASDLARSAAEVAARGGSAVAQVVGTMDEINQSSRKIADIIGVIDGIAFQTNILALNAAVEAARAGEQGRGFAVVAGEVRNLAQRSAEAAREIKALIGSSVDRVEAGTRQVQDAGATMNEIVQSVQRVSEVIGEITVAAREQSQGIGQVNAAVSDLDRMTQQNAALVEESAAAAESLKHQAGVLSQAVATFKLGRALTA